MEGFVFVKTILLFCTYKKIQSVAEQLVYNNIQQRIKFAGYNIAEVLPNITNIEIFYHKQTPTSCLGYRCSSPVPISSLSSSIEQQSEDESFDNIVTPYSHNKNKK